MRLLLDTHAMVWWLFDDATLSKTASRALSSSDNEIFVSAVSVWETAIKLSINKLPLPESAERDFLDAVLGSGFATLPVTVEHAYAVRHLPWYHRDPFDRLLVAQSRVEGLTLVTHDGLLARYDIDILW